MAFTKQSRLGILTVLVSLFFALELVVGYITGSVALIADAFHMLSDLFSLAVAWYAIKLAAYTAYDPQYTYGLQRAEVLGALINGVSLLALCFSISIEAIQRFFEPVHIRNPWLVVITGSAGLAMNICGLFLFHDHSHHGHGHGHGHNHQNSHHNHQHAHDDSHHNHDDGSALSQTSVMDNVSTVIAASSPIPCEPGPSSSISPQLTPKISRSIHPAQTRVDIVLAAKRLRHSFEAVELGEDELFEGKGVEVNLESQGDYDMSTATLARPSHYNLTDPLADHDKCPLKSSHSYKGHDHPHLPDPHMHLAESDDDRHSHEGHSRRILHANESENNHSHAHGHGDLNMHGVFLHVLGDALGSIGVIISTLIIIYAEGDWKYYMDPVMSLIITVLIIVSTVPLCKSATFILMQSVPSTMQIDTLRSEIMTVKGVISIHELHVWQLSDSKAIASVHVLVRDPAESSIEPLQPPYMEIASMIKKKLHLHGIHSTTIQPEFVSSKHSQPSFSPESGDDDPTEHDCFLSCRETSCETQRCCPPLQLKIVSDNSL
ncbi:Zinc resistance conferring protein [Batrachochytrium dendrobatidis]